MYENAANVNAIVKLKNSWQKIHINQASKKIADVTFSETTIESTDVAFWENN